MWPGPDLEEEEGGMTQLCAVGSGHSPTPTGHAGLVVCEFCGTGSVAVLMDTVPLPPNFPTRGETCGLETKAPSAAFAHGMEVAHPYSIFIIHKNTLVSV